MKDLMKNKNKMKNRVKMNLKKSKNKNKNKNKNKKNRKKKHMMKDNMKKNYKRKNKKKNTKTIVMNLNTSPERKLKLNPKKNMVHLREFLFPTFARVGLEIGGEDRELCSDYLVIQTLRVWWRIRKRKKKRKK